MHCGSRQSMHAGAIRHTQVNEWARKYCCMQTYARKSRCGAKYASTYLIDYRHRGTSRASIRIPRPRTRRCSEQAHMAHTRTREYAQINRPKGRWTISGGLVETKTWYAHGRPLRKWPKRGGGRSRKRDRQHCGASPPTRGEYHSTDQYRHRQLQLRAVAHT